MNDEVVMGLLNEADLRVVAVVATRAAREAASLHRARSSASVILGEALAGGALLAALQLQKQGARVNLQLECDGPLRGLFVEGDAQGTVRGYVKNPLCDLEGAPGPYRWRPAFGNSGFLSVLRDAGRGEYARSAVELEAFEVARDLERFFLTSEQLPTAVGLATQSMPGEPLHAVAGVLVQALPGGDLDTLERLRQVLHGEGLLAAIEAEGAELTPQGLVKRLCGPQASMELLSRYPLRWNCPCSKDRVTRALLTLGTAELNDILEKEGKAEASCHFCSTEYVVDGDELRGLLDRLEGRGVV
jgi:molecular chaperone Hsp33